MKKLKILNLFITGILIILSTILFSILFFLKIIPLKYFIILSIIYLLFLIFISYITIRKQVTKIKRILIIFLSMIIIFFLGFAFYYLNHTIKFMTSIKSKEYQIEEYYVLVRKSSTYQTLSDINNQTIATYQNQVKDYTTNLEKITNEIAIKEKEYPNHIEASQALLNHEIESLFISSSYKAISDEEIENFKDNVRILSKEQVKISSESITSNKKDITQESINIYISGIDISGDISLVSRSDVNMMMTLNPKTHQILLTSIPRDYYVQLHGTTSYKDKLTHSGIYGINMTVMTVEDLLDIKIDYYVRLNFTTLTNLVDEIDGIDIYSDKSFRAWTNSKCTFEKGLMHLDGQCALAFARERYAYEEGDRHRIQNQQDVVKAILNKTLTSKVLIMNYKNILETLSNSFQTNLPTEDIYKLINLQLETMPTWKTEQIRLDGYDASNYTYTYPTQHLYVMEPNQKTIEDAKQKIKDVMNH
ncbi:MAG: LCP family protein [Erysipelotrichaceae bacterium]|nr:LCP family protein [Erysipelotrichaceae bacterium]